MKTFAEAKQAWSEEISLAGYWYPRAWKRSTAIVDILRRFQVPTGAIITEFGCGGRRNLIALFDAGYKRVAGYDITDQLDVFKHCLDFCLIVIDNDPHKMPECDLCFTLAVLQHVTDDQLDATITAICARTRQAILLCENEIDETDGTYRHDYIRLFKEKGWLNFWWMPASEADGLDAHYVWRLFRPQQGGASVA
jgi:hypothetical protein